MVNYHYTTILAISSVSDREFKTSIWNAFFSPHPGLYPNLEELGDYMGLSLNSDEVQRNLALVPVADSVSMRMFLLL